MELLYLWINDYECFKNIGFNFGGKYLYSYDREKNFLSIRRNEDYIEDFFNDKDKAANIQNITAIVGKNGSGKTTLTKQLDEIFIPDKSDISVKDKPTYRLVFVIYGHDPSTAENKYMIHGVTYYSLQDLPISQIEFQSEFRNNHCLGNVSSGIEKEWARERYLTFYSPVVDGQYYSDENKEYGSYADISTNYLMFKADKEKITNENADDKKYIDSHIAHIIAENRRIVTFLKSEYSDSIFKQLNIRSLDALFFKPRYPRYKKSNNPEGNREKNNEEKTLIEKLSNALLERWNTTIDEDSLMKYLDSCSSDPKKLFKELIKLNLIYSRAQIQYNPSTSKEQRSVEIKTEDDFNKILVFAFNDNKHISHSGDNLGREFLKESLSVLNTILDGFLSKIPANIEMRNYDDYSFTFIAKNENAQKWLKETLLKSLDDVFTQFKADHLLDIRFPRYSSGEIAMLKLYSRFWDIKDSVNRQSNVMILIDEGEIYLHPQWQKEFLNNIIEMCKAFFEGKNIQIIFTTNNPIMLSDMPTQNIIFLEKDKDQTVSSTSINVQQTFGSSITKILADSFFLKGGMIGDFAKKKINEIIKWLDNPLENTQEIIDKEEYISRTIRLIGEPLIRNHLEQKFHEAINNIKLSVHDKEISSLKKRLDSLERKNGEDK